jgi:hypothetical protein
MLPAFESPALIRGNQGVAAQDRRPESLSKVQLLALASLRAAPYLQLRKLLGAVEERTLPLSHPLVLPIVRMLLHHVGTLSGDVGSEAKDATYLPWKTDLMQGDFRDKAAEVYICAMMIINDCVNIQTNHIHSVHTLPPQTLRRPDRNDRSSCPAGRTAARAGLPWVEDRGGGG